MTEKTEEQTGLLSSNVPQNPYERASNLYMLNVHSGLYAKEHRASG